METDVSRTPSRVCVRHYKDKHVSFLNSCDVNRLECSLLFRTVTRLCNALYNREKYKGWNRGRKFVSDFAM
jgi:hypothetical protein